ncbi:cytochrome c biogenesis protein [Geobacter sp. DSM 9736]|uniref:cytochrome c biogenesis protein n=1 Tax=Geobacter sp. DSM 9736 TaxID=1277350 RepID=UPI000B512906|nr:cytochrome c biogenesis protein CcsA [Geobacter sp. DSM 9736]SNB47389.1 cytochrome c-type biogenesis protein CcsB [Geobacter sp. DSM 9736]
MNDLFAVSVTGHWGAVVIYIAAFIFNVTGHIFDKEKARQLSVKIAAAGLILHGGVLIYWWSVTGHGPYMARHEVLSSDAWVLMATFLLFCRKFPRLKPAALVAFPSTFLMTALALFSAPEIHNLPPTLRSIWLVIHVLFYKIAFGTLVISLALAIVFLLKKHRNVSWLDRFPDASDADLLSYRFAGFGFTFWATGMLAGSIWAYQSWGRFWGWDPVETWSLITWGVMGIYLHLRRFFNWREEKAAGLLFAAFVVAVAAKFLTPLLSSSIHSEYFK